MPIRSPASLRSAFAVPADAVPADVAYFNTANLSPVPHAVRRPVRTRFGDEPNPGRSDPRTGPPTWSGCAR